VFPDGLSHFAVGCNPSRKVRRARRADSETTGGPTEKAAHTDGSVIQTGIVIALPCGDLQTTQSPLSRRNLRETGRFAQTDHR
jgi:hypothetical protein